MALITMRETEFKRVLESKDTFATALMAVLLDEYSTDFLEWEPSALYMQIDEDFHAQVPDVNKDKIGAMIVAMTTNQFFINADIFANTCKALGHSEADFSIFRPITPEELAWGVTEVVLNNPPDKTRGNTECSEEVASFVGMMLLQQGVLKPPSVLQFATYPTKNPVEDIQTMFADDPSMFEAAMANQTQGAEAIEDHTKETLKLLKHQLELLPLSTKK